MRRRTHAAGIATPRRRRREPDATA